MAQQPNLLLLMSDHQLHYRHGWDSGPRIQRPHFDALADDGVRFNRAYTVCPLCTPARRSILTSLYPHTHGQLQNRPTTPIQNEIYNERLTAAGYRNYYFGKWHAGPGTAQDYGWEGYSLAGYGNPYLSTEYQAYLAERGLTAPEILVERDFAQEQRIAHNTRYQQADPAGCWEHMSGVMQAEDDAHEAFFLANLACEQLQAIAKTESAQPFSMRVDFWSPHQPYFPTPAFANLYDPCQIPPYGSFTDSLETKPQTYLRELNYPIGNAAGKLIQPNALSWSDWQQVLARCYAQVTLVDAAGGRILDTLAALGLAENTLVIWTADHGDALASHGGHFNKGCYLSEEVLRIPLAMRYPEQIDAGQVSEALVSNLDLAPTLLAAAGTQFTAPIQGANLLTMFENSADNWRTALMCESNGHDSADRVRALITKDHKLIKTETDCSELYALGDDPYQRQNLYGQAELAPLQLELEQLLTQHQLETKDVTA